jgi:hypothetical protein
MNYRRTDDKQQCSKVENMTYNLRLFALNKNWSSGNRHLDGNVHRLCVRSLGRIHLCQLHLEVRLGTINVETREGMEVDGAG